LSGLRLEVVAVALVATAHVWATDNAAGTSSKAPPLVSTVTIQLQHRTVDLAVDFDTFSRNLVSLLGHFNPADVTIAATDLKRGLERLQASQGEQGLMLFDGTHSDHGALFPLVGKPARKSIRYHIGNPLIAIRMEQKNMGVALYAPLTVLAYELTPGSVRVEYDLPTSTFGQFHDPDIDKVAAILDPKLYALLLKAAGVSN
jgi:uncharacterized protein (DUF302 family)